MEAYIAYFLIVAIVQGLELFLYLTPPLPHEAVILCSTTSPGALILLFNLYSKDDFPRLFESYYWNAGLAWTSMSLVLYCYLLLRSKAKSRFPPLVIPWRRRGQTLFTMICWPMPIWGLIAIFFLLAHKWARWPYIVWELYVVFIDKTPSRGGWRKRRWWTASLPMRLCCEFFPCTLVKEADLDPGRRYIFGYHPHGILSIGAWCQFCTEGTGLSETFPGLEIRLMTLKQIFWTPIFRWFLMMGGGIDVSKESIAHQMKTPGNAVVIIVGGAVESLDTAPGTMDLTLRRRLGFVKQALLHGADLVPVISFGENDLFETVADDKNLRMKAIQKRLQKMLSVAFPIFHGRGMFNYSFGLLPYRRPITTVVGPPLRAGEAPVPAPTPQQVAELHARYMDALRKLYDRHKDCCAPGRKRDLVIK